MAVHRDRVDPVQTPDAQMLVHRRWILPDDLEREMPLTRIAPLWRGLAELNLLDPGDDAVLDVLALPPSPGVAPQQTQLPAVASAGALLAGGGAAILITQMVWLSEDGRRDPYAADGASDVGGWRDYTLYAVAHDSFLLMPLRPAAILCAKCGQESDSFAAEGGAQGVWAFGQAALIDLNRKCPHCAALLDLGRDRARLRNGSVFLLEETCSRAALSIEMPTAPEAEELPDAKVAELLISVFGGTDELSEDRVPAS